jgi:alpha-tubulin suppressor-like RCC1 family protein
LGIGHNNPVKMPTLVESLQERIIDVSGGGNHSLFLSDKGIVYSCGLDREGNIF